MTTARRAWRATVIAGSVLAGLGLANTVRNLRIFRTPPMEGSARKVSALLPLRDEEARARDCLVALREQDIDEIVVLDDNSSDGTAALVEQVLGGDPRLRLIRGDTEPPSGWLGKPWACQRLADAATGEALVFVDADVVLTPSAARRAAAMLDDLDAVCPYPRQLTSTPLGRLVQPLLQWSWLTTLPLDVAERSPRPSTAAGNGQFLVVGAQTYRAVGGHTAVAGEVLEDVAFIRAVKAAGGTGGMVDGTDLAVCRMYQSDAELVAGYTKSLWSAFGSPVGAAATVAVLSLAYVVPPVAAAIGPDRAVRTIGLAGYGAAALGRILVARRTGQRVAPDAFAHPLSIATFGWLVAESFRRRRAGALAWRGRPVHS